MSILNKICWFYFVVLALVTSLNYIPGVVDDFGLVAGTFELDIKDDLLHLMSAMWALTGAVWSKRAARIFLIYFGGLYLGDGLLGLATGSGYLDLGICFNGILDLPFGFKVFANVPHISLGALAFFSGLFLDRD